MKRALSCIGIVLMLAWVAGDTVAAGSAQVGFSPPSASASVGAAVTVDVTVANVAPEPGLASYDLTLRFDPAVVRIDSFSDAGFVTSGQNVVICAPGPTDNAGGSANAVCTAIPLFGAPGVSTTRPVALLHASFTALAEGTSSLTLSGSLSGPTGTAIAASFSGGTIRVSAGGSPAPIATRPASGTATGAPKAPAAGTGGGHGASSRTFLVLIVAGAVAIAIAGTVLVGRKLRGDRP